MDTRKSSRTLESPPTMLMSLTRPAVGEVSNKPLGYREVEKKVRIKKSEGPVDDDHTASMTYGPTKGRRKGRCR